MPDISDDLKHLISIGAEEPPVKRKRKVRPKCKTCGNRHYNWNEAECVSCRNYKMGT